jgi:hypothetical protein
MGVFRISGNTRGVLGGLTLAVVAQAADKRKRNATAMTTTVGIVLFIPSSFSS